MPGRKLSDVEIGLINFWTAPPRSFKTPLLKGLIIEGPPSLRGIERISVPFNYPITALCGRNGVGKSTVLALAAFSSKKPDDWAVASWPTSPTRRQPKLTAYNWTDFFFRQRELPPLDGLKVTFNYLLNGNDVQVVRQRAQGRWKTLPDPGRSRPPSLPLRPIEFVSLARILPPSELHYVRKHFKSVPITAGIPLSTEMCTAMTGIFGRQYDNIQVQKKGGVTLASCTSGATEYSGFDMGAGENAVITIFSRLQQLPAGGLLIVEEIEHGLHNEAQSKLVDALTSIVRNRRQQIIFTTHSSDIIDRLPREGRVLIQRVGGDHRTVERPTTRFATFSMSGIAQPEGMVFVEDNFAAALVLRCLPRDLRMRVRVVPIGDKSRVATQLGAHIRGNAPGPAKCVFDGDCRDAEIRGWMHREEQAEDGSNYVILPGNGLVPEHWVLNAIKENPYLENFADRLNITRNEATAELDRLLLLPEHHDIPYQFAQQMSFDVAEAVTELVAAVAPRHPELEHIRQMVREMLN